MYIILKDTLTQSGETESKLDYRWWWWWRLHFLLHFLLGTSEHPPYDNSNLVA